MRRGYVYLVLAALSYASMGSLIKALSVDFGPFWQTFLRLVVSFLLTLLLVLLTKKPLRLQHKKDYMLMPLMGIVGYGLQIILFTASLYHNTIGNTLFIFCCYPILTAVLAHFVLKEKMTKRLSVALVLIFCVLFLLFDPNNIAVHFLGNTYAFLASITFAIYIICSRILSKRGNAAETITLWSVALAVLTSGVGALIFEKFAFSFSATSIFYLVLFGFLNAAAFNFVNKGFATVNAAIGTMVLLLEPIIGSLLGLVLFHEFPTALFMVGATVMITAIYVATFKLD